MPFGGFSGLSPKPEHIAGVTGALADGELRSPQDIAKLSGLSLSQVLCALNELEAGRRLTVVRQNVSPKVRVALVKRGKRKKA